MPSAEEPLPNEIVIGPGLPTFKIGDGTRKLVYLPGLTLDAGLPTGKGRTGAVSGWEPLLDRYTVYRPARRTGGGSTSFEQMAADVAEAIEDLGGPVDLMGFSTGGVICIHLAATRPALVRRLVLVATGPRVGPSGRQGALDALAAIRSGSWRRFFATILPVSAKSGLGRLVFIAIGWLLGPRIIGIPRDPSQLVAELEAWAEADASELIERIGCPVLVIGAERDRVFPPSRMAEWTPRLQNGTVTIVEGKGHSWPPGTLETLVSPFLG